MENLVRELNDFYFGKDEFEEFGNYVYRVLAGRTISKRIDLADYIGGLRYEAKMLNMDMFKLLRTIEGMCYNGWAREIDDSTYIVCKLSEYRMYGIIL